MNIINVPAQAEGFVGVIDTAGVTKLVTVTVTALLVALGVEAHDALLVITTETTSLLLSVDEEKVLPVPATLTPFIFH